MKLHYKLYTPEDGGYVAVLLEAAIVISGDTLEEIDIEIKNAVDGHIQAFGEKDFFESSTFEIKEFEYNVDERRKKMI